MTQALQSLLELAERDRDEAMALLLRSEEAHRRLRQQQEQLSGYRADYEARAPGLDGRAAPIDMLRHHQVFMQRLQQALTQQEAQLQTAQAQVLRSRQQLLHCETRVASVRKLIQRRAQERQRQESRLDQNRSDEATAQRRWHDSAQGRTALH
jgi:flagellar protein FliJ